MKNSIKIDEFTEFLKTVDIDFPIPLSSKVDINEYANKLLKDSTISLYRNDDNILGIVCGYTKKLKDNIAYISIVAVNKENRGRGIATKLVLDFLEICRSEKIDAVHLYTHKTNVKAIKMYYKLGFKEYIIPNEERLNDIHLIKYI